MKPKELLNGVDGGWGLLLDALADGKILYDPHGLLKRAKEKVLKKHQRKGEFGYSSFFLLKRTFCLILDL